jgi:hypothetical protein
MLLAGLSCLVDNVPEGLPDELPDHTVENLEGMFLYIEEEKTWGFTYAIDYDILGYYTIINTDNKFLLEKDKKALISGRCYLIKGYSSYVLYLTDLTYI